MVIPCAVTPNASRVRGATIVHALLAAALVAWLAAGNDRSRLDRAEFALGSVWCGYGLAALLRRGQAVATECVTTLPRSRGGDGLTRIPCPGMLMGGALLAAMPRALEWTRFGTSGLGFGLATAPWPALALALGVVVSRVLTGVSLSAVPVPTPELGALALVLLIAASVLALPGFHAAFARYVPPYRVRFEIGGLGTRIEDLTPIEEQELRPAPAFTLLVCGAGALLLGGAALPSLGIALLVAPGVVLASHLLSAPVVVVALLGFGACFGSSLDYAAPLLVLLAACESQRVALLDRTTAPRVSQVRGWILASVVAIALAAIGLLGSTATEPWNGSGSARTVGIDVLRSIRVELLVVVGALVVAALLARSRPVLRTALSAIATCLAIGIVLPQGFAALFVGGALLAIVLRFVVPAWRHSSGALDLGDLALGIGLVEIGFYCVALGGS